MMPDGRETAASPSFSSLVSRKALLEARISQLHASLASLGSDLDSSLIDAQGFPRSDVDIVAVKGLRSELRVHLNDHKALMAATDQFLARHFQQGSAPIEAPACLPIALVRSILPDSAADLAGLLPNDQILKFGPLDRSSLVSFATDFRQVLEQREGQTISVAVVRRPLASHAQNLAEKAILLSLRLPPKSQSIG